MEKLKTLKSLSNDEDRTKQKLPISTLKTKVTNNINQKPTVASRNRSYNQLATKLISQSAIISEQSSVVQQKDSEEVVQVDPLCIYEIDEIVKNKYQINHGVMFDVQDYTVIFGGRHQIEFRNGLPVALYVPPIFTTPRDPKTHKIEVIIERKLQTQVNDPLQYPYIIIDPFNSIYPTYICSWIECKRKITLQHYIQYNQKLTQPLAIGNCIHRYLQWLIRKQVQPKIPTQSQMHKLYLSFLYDMYIIDLPEQLFVERIEQGIINLVNWYQQHVIKGKVIELNRWDKKYLKITRTLGSQVMIKSKYFGIRGKVDGLFQGNFIDEKLGIRYDVIIPFQLKTGRKIMDSHKKQIDFYNLLLRQNKNMPVIGLLYYSQSNIYDYRMQNPLICFENINIHRNKIIINILNLYSESSILKLPILPQLFDQCKLCDVTSQCAVTRLSQQKLKQIKDIQDIGQDVPQKYNVQIRKKIKNLTVLQFAYLKKWTQLLHLQQYAQKNQNSKNLKKQFFGKITLQLQQLQNFKNYKQGETLNIKLIKKIQSHQMSEVLDNYFKVGEKLRIFIPIIRLADSCRIASNSKNTKIFCIQVQIKNQNIKFDRRKVGFLLEDREYEYFEVDMQKYQNSFYNYMRGYCYKFVEQAQPWLKSIVIQQNYQPTQKLMIKQQPKQLQTLNDDQRKAFLKCVEQQRFCLVQGMPGTGKTQLILKLIQYFYRQGKTILVTSFTNQSLTNILYRQINRQKKIPQQHIIREGSKFGITQQYEHLSSQSQQLQSINQYKKYFKSKKVWFVTISSLYIQHLPTKFDVIIIDQASQCLEANCLQAIMKSNKFILIGDQRQLQPVVKSKQALQKGMQISLFQRLCKMYKNNKATLKKQYRMSPAIMNLTNNLVYNGQLQLACPQMKVRKLQIIPQWKQKTPQYLYSIIDPQKSLRFINYDSALNLFSEGDNIDLRKIKRLLQIRIACSLYKQFLLLGVKKQSILIISAYNSLVHQLVAALKRQKLIQANTSEVLTIDKSQGTDKQVIIFIFSKGNKELIQNYRRLNVALTRARNKFVIVGSQKELSQLATWTGRLATLLQPDQINIQRDFLEALLQ